MGYIVEVAKTCVYESTPQDNPKKHWTVKRCEFPLLSTNTPTTYSKKKLHTFIPGRIASHREARSILQLSLLRRHFGCGDVGNVLAKELESVWAVQTLQVLSHQLDSLLPAVYPLLNKPARVQ